MGDAAMQMKLRELQNQIKEIKSQRDELEYKIQATSLQNDNNVNNWMQKELPNEDAIMCSCKKQSSGKVIKCDNSECKIQWFHWKCVGVKQQRVEWYCPDCRRYSYATSSLHPKFKNRNIQSNKNDEESEYKMQTTDPNPPKDNESNGNGIICTCKKLLSEEKRIKCDNSLCAVQWYHWKCARISNKPSYEWYCKQCRKYWTKSNILHPKFQGAKTLNKQIQSDENDEMTYEY